MELEHIIVPMHGFSCISIRDERLTTDTQIQNFMLEKYQAGNPVRLIYLGNSVREESITLPSVLTQIGTNILSVGTTIQPNSMSVTYKSGTILGEKGVNTPKITEGMIPIKWNGSNWVVCARDDENWYNYTEEKMEWANMMLSDGTYKADTVSLGQVVEDSDLGSMFVWIPRYAYSMTHYKTSFEGTADVNNGTTQNITRVVFLKGTTNEDASGNRYAKDYDVEDQTVGKETEMIVHPAFTFGGQELTGIWVAKFEASQGANDVVKVLPNVQSWRNITIGNSFSVSYNMRNKKIDNKNVYGITENTNTHLMKNSEWGAVAYLVASQYGRIPALSNTGTNYYTAGSGTEGNYKNDLYLIQSSTGTVHGVYDLNGGAWERVAAYYDNGYDNLGNGNTTGLTMFDSTNGYKLDSEWSAYWDKYEVEGDDGAEGYSSKNNEIIAKAAYARLQLMKNKKGDATYEVINDLELSFYGWKKESGSYTSTNIWIKAHFIKNGSTLNVSFPNGEEQETRVTGLYDGDHALIGTCVQTFTIRDGSFSNNSGSGVFNFNGSNGGANLYVSFRPVLW